MSFASNKLLSHRESDTPIISDSTSMASPVVSPTVPRLHDTSSQHFALVRTSEEPLLSSFTPIRRKPLPPTASHLATRYSSGDQHVAKLELPSRASLSQHPVADVSKTIHVEFPPWESTDLKLSRRLSQESDDRSTTGLDTKNLHLRNTLPGQSVLNLAIPKSILPSTAFSRHSKTNSSASTFTSDVNNSWFGQPSPVTPSRSIMTSLISTLSNEILPSRNLHSAYSSLNESVDSNSRTLGTPSMTTQASSLSSFFGWRDNFSPALSTTTVSDNASNSNSPLHHPEKDIVASNYGSQHKKPTAINIPMANAQTNSQFQNKSSEIPLPTPISPFQVDDMEHELQEISTELAASIRREMELEDLVERLQTDVQISSCETERRTSDYFSDGGISSVKFGLDPDSKQDEINRLLRKNEQAKAQMKLELTMTVQEERSKRRKLELKIRDLEEKASNVDLGSIDSIDTSERVRELESTCEELRRRLKEERQQNDRSSDLLSMLKAQLQKSLNERDNLRDEVVPQLRARVEGLEAQAAEHEKLTYDQSKVQQELQALRGENLTLINNQKMQVEMKNQMERFSMMAENSDLVAARRASSTSWGTGQVQSSRPRSSTMKASESREVLAGRLKDIEFQRDSLHVALKSLLERQEYQNRENQKIIKNLEMELERALLASPRKNGYGREVKCLRDEIDALRSRADEAMRQKWQCEKSLFEVKVNLDRAEKELKSNKRLMLSENHVSIQMENLSSGGTYKPNTLEDSYKDLQTTYMESLERIRSLGMESISSETLQALKLIERSLLSAISERNQATRESEILKEQNKALLDAEDAYFEHGKEQANEILDFAKRFEDLAVKARRQISTNSTIRQRLASTIERGEKERDESSQKISYMQKQLKSLEDQLLLAQETTQKRLTAHEEDLKEMKDSQSLQLHRIREGFRSPISPNLAKSIKSPRGCYVNGALTEDSKVHILIQKIANLEQALLNADREMEKVVTQMNAAQIQVIDLQNEREEAIRETKRLQSLIENEKNQANSKTWTSLLTS